MDALRTVVARFSVAVDAQPLDALDTKISKLKGNWGAMTFIATSALASVGAASYQFVEAASAATEVQNKISAIFGDETRSQIEAWSKTVEAEMGRSEFAFQKTFSDFAAFLDPMQLGIDRTIEMSKQLSKLSVDLASFYDTSEKEAQMRLFSGMAGETEAVRRLGIDISDTALEALYNSEENPLAPGKPGETPNKKRNKGKGLASLQLADKTILRHYKIMKDTAKAQGDAARTAGGWANTMKRLTDRFAKFSVHVGRLIEGPGTRFLNMLEGVVESFDTIVTKTKAVQTAVTALAAAAVGFGTRWVYTMTMASIANGKFYTSFLPMALAVAKWAAVLAIVEDFWTFITEDDATSGFGELAKAITGLETPAKLIRDLFRDWSGYVQNVVDNLTTLPTWLGGKGVEGLTGFSNTSAFSGRAGIDAAAAERRAARTKAMQADNIEEFVKNRRSDQSIAESEAEFRDERRNYASTLSADQLTQEDIKAGYGFRQERMVGGGGHVTVAPVMNIVINTPKVDAEDIRKHAKGALNEAAKAAAAERRRRAPKGQ